MVLPNDDVFAELGAFFSKYFHKKAQSSAQTLSLPFNNGVTQWWHFRGALPFFSEIFFSKVWWIIWIAIALSRNQSISVPTKCTQTPTFFCCTDSSWIMFVLAQHGTNLFPPIALLIDEQQRTALRSAVWSVETCLVIRGREFDLFIKVIIR